MPQFLSEEGRAAFDKRISPELRRKVLIAGAAASLLVASFQAYDEISTKNRALAQAARTSSQRTITEVSISPYRAKETDDVLNVVALPARIIVLLTFSKGKTITLKDKVGAAASSPITIIADEGAKIDSLPILELRSNFGSAGFIWDGKEWSIY